jgi:hypothetical protein
VRRHAVDIVSLVFGALFLVTALAFVGGERRVTDVPVAWLWAVPVVAVGLAATLGGVRSAMVQRRRATDDKTPEGEAAGDEEATA